MFLHPRHEPGPSKRTHVHALEAYYKWSFFAQTGVEHTERRQLAHLSPRGTRGGHQLNTESSQLLPYLLVHLPPFPCWVPELRTWGNRLNDKRVSYQKENESMIRSDEVFLQKISSCSIVTHCGTFLRPKTCKRGLMMDGYQELLPCGRQPLESSAVRTLWSRAFSCR
jgi:hypothetical protein